MNTKSKEFLLKHLSILVDDLDHFIEEKKIILIAASKSNFMSLPEKVALNSKIVNVTEEKLLAKQCIEEISKL